MTESGPGECQNDHLWDQFWPPYDLVAAKTKSLAKHAITVSEGVFAKNIPVCTASQEGSDVLRRAVIVAGLSGESGLPGPGPGATLDGILLWDRLLAARVTSAGGILVDRKEQVLLRARRQNPGSSQSVINVVMAPAAVHELGVPGEGVPGQV